MRSTFLLSVGALLLSASPVIAQTGSADPAKEGLSQQAAADTSGKWITLGTMGGPVTSPTRSQPANLLQFNGKKYLVDVGDGAAGQISKAGLQTAMLDGVFISHLHFDHTGGLAAILGLRFQTNPRNKLKVFGPPGTKQLVDGIVMSMKPGATANYGVEGVPTEDPRDQVEVVELRDKNTLSLDGMKISVRKNSHYSFKPGGDMARRFESLSYRFDMPGRSIVYTGDTGPSAAVEELAKDADLLIAEMMDVPLIVQFVQKTNPNMPEPAARAMEAHLTKHHLLAKDVGELAGRANVKSLVVTHYAGAELPDPKHFEYLKTIAEHYDGPAVIANDMEAF